MGGNSVSVRSHAPGRTRRASAGVSVGHTGATEPTSQQSLTVDTSILDIPEGRTSPAQVDTGDESELSTGDREGGSVLSGAKREVGL